jgi:tripartite-type tricarboxylate transporter receptor subunit TctC
MKLPSLVSLRRWVRRGLCAAAIGWLAAGGAAQAAYPDRPITVIVPYPVGGATDTLARFVGQQIGEILHQSVVVENRAGGSGFIGMGVVSRAPADGYTLLFGSVADAAIYTAAAGTKPAVNLSTDFAPVAAIANAPHLLVVPAGLPVDNLQGLVAYLKQAPGKYNFASIGVGTLSQLEGELLMLATGVKIEHLPYKGGAQALVELIAGNSTLMFLSAPNAVPHVKSGKIKVLAVASDRRLPMLPEVPTIAQAGIQGFNAENLFGFYSVKGTPPAIVDRISAAMKQALQDPALKSKIEDQGMLVDYMDPKAFGEQTADDFRTYADIVKRADIRLE